MLSHKMMLPENFRCLGFLTRWDCLENGAASHLEAFSGLRLSYKMRKLWQYEAAFQDEAVWQDDCYPNKAASQIEGASHDEAASQDKTTVCCMLY